VTWPSPDRPANNSPLTGSFTRYAGSSSFAEFLRRQAPELLPTGRPAGGVGPAAGEAFAHGTTIVALRYPGGVLIAGDRRSTQGNMIAGRDVQKVYITDDYTATGIAGTAALAVEFARLYAVELEHYEKLQGFVALPLLVGYDLDDPDANAAGRIVSFDAAGGWHIEEEGYQAVGSGSLFAKSSMKKLYPAVTEADSALKVAVEALYDAADDDSATGGPDLVRGIFPTAVTIDANGAQEVTGERIERLAREVIAVRTRTDEFGPGTGPSNVAPRADS
jgi:proteasome beta subunit